MSGSLATMVDIPVDEAVQVALTELARPTHADTQQPFQVHELETEGDRPRVFGVLPGDGCWGVCFRPQNEFYDLVMMVDHEGGEGSIRGCRASARARVALSIVSEDLTAQAITQATGLELTDSWSRGNLRTHPRMRHLGPCAFTRWTLCPEGDLPGEFEDKLTRLLQLTEPAAARIRALADTCDVSILVGYQGYTGQLWGLPIEARDVARIAALGAAVDVDRYASGPALP